MTRWKLVLVEPDESMIIDAMDAPLGKTPEDRLLAEYAALLAASPSPGEDEELMMRVRFAVSDPGRVVGARDANETLQNWQARAVIAALEG